MKKLLISCHNLSLLHDVTRYFNNCTSHEEIVHFLSQHVSASRCDTFTSIIVHTVEKLRLEEGRP